MEKQGGIYQIRNIINNKVYIGSAINFKQRWKKHKEQLKKGMHPNTYLQNAWNKYGENSFVFEITEIIKEIDQLIPKEQYYKDLYKSYDRNFGYDIRKIAESNLGIKCSEKSRKKHSKSQKGKRHTEKARRNMSLAKIGKIFTIKHKKELSKSQIGNKNALGHKCSNEAKQKMSLIRKNKYIGENHPWFGKHHSEETKQKMREAKLGKKQSEQHKISTSNAIKEWWESRKNEQKL